MIRKHENNAAKLFKEWASLFSEKLFVIIKFYVDESASYDKDGKMVFFAVGGFASLQENWIKFATQWRAVLDKHKIKNFHFREFNAKANYSDPQSQYYKMNLQDRDDLFYDLAMVTSENLVPVGGSYPIRLHVEKTIEGNPVEFLIAAFFNDIREAISAHWPEINGSDFSSKALLIFDKTTDKKWKKDVLKVYDFFSERDARIGGLTFEDDEDPKHIGLQAADFLSAIYRQAAEMESVTGKRQEYRIIDLIFFRNLREKDHPWNMSRIHPSVFKLMIDLFRMEEKKTKKEWAARGIKNKIYYVTEHFPFDKYKLK